MQRAPTGFFAGPTFDLGGRRRAYFSNTYRVGGCTPWELSVMDRAAVDQRLQRLPSRDRCTSAHA